jgi:tol-pal system protein YbgF
MHYLAILVAVFVLTLSGCGSSKWSQSEEWRLRNLEEHFLEFQEEQRRQMAEAQKLSQDVDTRLVGMEEELSRNREQAARLFAEFEAMKSSRQMQANTMAPAPMKPAIMSPTPMTPTGMKSSAVPAPRSTKAAKKRTSSRDARVSAYMAALDAAKSGKTDKARALLNEFIADHPKSTLLPNALYWLGETYYHDDRYAQSILTFKEVTRRYPKNDKAAASMLKTGFAYERLGDTDNARFYLETLLEEYPNGQPAKLAREKLKTLQ